MDTSSFTPLEFSDAFKQYYSSLRNPSSIPFTTPLHSAVLDGNYDRVVFLLSVKRINPNVQDKNGCTPLHHACLLGHLRLVSLLLSHGANPNATTVDDNTPLHKAAQGGHRECAQLLLDHNADPTLRNQKGEMAITVCAWRKHTEITAFLKQVNAPVEVA